MKHSKIWMTAVILVICGTDTSASQSDTASSPATIYNLQGQRLDTLQRGVNIVGGKKLYTTRLTK